VLDDILLTEPGEADVTVRNGIATLTGTLDPRTGPHGGLISLALQLMWDIDGVVNIVDRLGETPAVPGERGDGPSQAASVPGQAPLSRQIPVPRQASVPEHASVPPQAGPPADES
jgi:hypothetical protein